MLSVIHQRIMIEDSDKVRAPIQVNSAVRGKERFLLLALF
jgi:hypothetical protein